MLVHELINQGQSDEVAFWGRDKSVTYGELQSIVKSYRNYFYHQGIRPGDRVGLFSRNSAEYVYSYVAVVSLGAIVVPLNFQLVSREISYIVKDAGIKFVVTMSRLELDGVEQLIIPEFSGLIKELNIEDAPEVKMHADDICTIIYTSGTTGNPKGAQLTHHNLVSNAQSFTQVLPVAAEDNVLCVLPMYHCFAWTCAVLATLLKGASITVADMFSRDTATLVREAGVTVVYAVPAMYHMLVKWNVSQELKGVKWFISGGSSLPAEVAEQFFQQNGKRIIEGYGLSEASPVVCLNPLERTKNYSVGRPIPGVKVRIVDMEGNDLPAGEIGELIVQGPNVMQGYYNLPEDSAAALKNGWLHTGDLAMMDREGYVFIKDRLKDMIITSGENIYPREIEELLYQHPDISEAAVVGVPDKVRGQAAYAYIVPVEGAAVDKKAVREYLLANLAAYKVPKTYKIVDKLPKNGTGKIMKMVLREQARRNALGEEIC